MSESAQDKVDLAVPAVSRPLPSGRQVVVRVDEQGETVEIRSPGGEVEIGIALTSSGPLLRLKGVRLEIAAAESVDVHCRRLCLRADEQLELHAGEGLVVTSERDLRVRTQGQTHIDGDWVNVNCEDRTGTGWHDDPSLEPPAK